MTTFGQMLTETIREALNELIDTKETECANYTETENETTNKDYNILTINDCIFIECKLPGFNRDEIEVKIIDDVLTVTAISEDFDDEFEDCYIHKHFDLDKVEFKFKLSTELSHGDFDISLDLGILTIKIERVKTEEKSRFFEIN